MLENFPVGRHDDEVDGLSGAHGVLCGSASGGFTSEQLRQAMSVQSKSKGVFDLGDSDVLSLHDLDLL